MINAMRSHWKIKKDASFSPLIIIKNHKSISFSAWSNAWLNYLVLSVYAAWRLSPYITKHYLKAFEFCSRFFPHLVSQDREDYRPFKQGVLPLDFIQSRLKG